MPLPEELIRIPAPDRDAARSARRRLDALAKPPQSLGRLEDLAVRVAAMTGQARPRAAPRAVVVLAGDHGVAAEGVSAYPAELTARMVAEFVRGGAAVSVLAAQAGAALLCVDVGLRTGVPPPAPAASRRRGDGRAPARLLAAKIRPGTANLTRGPAMTREQARRSLLLGERLAGERIAEGVRLLAGGDMGIGNTTAAAAMVAALTGAAPERVVGPGTGVDEAGIARKRDAVRRGLRVNRPDPADPLGVLAAVGGLEIGALAGLYLGAARRRVPVVVDGVVCGAAALLAEAAAPGTRSYLVPGHLSSEPAHRLALEALDLEPYLDLGLHLGEGTGAVLAFHLVEAALRVLTGMATLASLGAPARAEGG